MIDPKSVKDTETHMPLKRIGIFPLLMLVFFTVSGGPFGLEELVQNVGASWTFLLMSITPLLWAVPLAFVMAELNGRSAAQGGYYIWVRDAVSPYWGVQEGWWTLSYTVVDIAIYPVLFADYLGALISQIARHPGLHWLVAFLVIIGGILINWRGIRFSGYTAAISFCVLIVPFIAFVILAAMRGGAVERAVYATHTDLARHVDTASIAIAMSIAMWNYSGWDNVSTYAAEVERPNRTYPIALLVALPLIACVYLFPLLAGFSISVAPETWADSNGWPFLAAQVGGRWFGNAIATTACLSMFALFCSQLLYTSRLPAVMAKDNVLPLWLGTASERGVPIRTICGFGLAAGVLAIWSFKKLVVFEMILYFGALLLQFLALIKLRVKAGSYAGFKVPLGNFGLFLAVSLPVLFLIVVLISALVGTEFNKLELAFILITLVAGNCLFVFRRVFQAK